MKVKTNTLTGLGLGYAVALAEGYQFGPPSVVHDAWGFNVTWPDGTKSATIAYVREPRRWSNLPDFVASPDGDDIIDREGISVIRCDDDHGTDSEGFTTSERIPVWAATLGQFGYTESTEHQHHDAMYQIYVDGVMYGPTRRIAAMRAWVEHKLGEAVEIPDELLEKA